MRSITVLSIGILGLGLNACSSAKDQLGLNKTVPDEFAVVKRAPLAMPPSYNLEPPRPGAPRPQEQAPSVTAAKAVFGAETMQAKQSADQTAADAALLQKAGAEQSAPDIRRIVDSETSQVDEKSKPVVDRILGWGGVSRSADAEVIDPKEEAERLKNTSVESAPVESEDP